MKIKFGDAQHRYDNALPAEERPGREAWQEHLESIDDDELLDHLYDHPMMKYDTDYREEMTKRGLTFYL